MEYEHVIPRDALEGVELVLRRHPADRDQLDAVFLAIGRVDEQIAEAARALGRAQRGAQGVDALLPLLGVGHVEDEASVAALVVVLAAEQRGLFVEQR